MKSRTYIIIGLILILIVLGVWTYLIFTGRDGEDVFTGFGEGGDVVFPERALDDDSAVVVDERTNPLRQLTTKPVVGAVHLGNVVRFVERGTGYVYDVSVRDGKETQVTGTTLPRVVEATFSENGGRVIFASEDGGVRKVLVGTITKNDVGEGVIDGVSLPDGAREVAFSEDDNAVHYLLSETTGSSAYTYDLLEKTQTLRFTIPLQDVRALWGTPDYVVTTPAALQKGHLYEVRDDALLYVMPSEFGLLVERIGERLLFSGGEKQLTSNTFLAGKVSPFSPAVYPEKCAGSLVSTSTIYCGGTFRFPETDEIEDWYKGLISYTDNLWMTNAEIGNYEPVGNLLELSGREIDISKLHVSEGDRHLYFINKNDDSLWLYDLESE